QFQDNDRRTLERGESQTYEETGSSGGAPWLFLTTRSVFRDPQGKILGVIGVARDITRRKQNEEALRLHSQRLEAMQEIDRSILAARSPEEIARAALVRLRFLVP